jgi:hypothetical protein
MKVTLEKVKIMETSLAKIVDKEVDVIAAYKISKLIKQTAQELTTLEESRIKLVQKYASDKPAEDGTVSVAVEKQGDFHNEYRKLLSQEIEVDFDPIPITSLGDIKLTALDVLSLEGVVLETEKKEEAPAVEPEVVSAELVEAEKE